MPNTNADVVTKEGEVISYLVQIGEDTFEVEGATSRYNAKKIAAGLFMEKYDLKDVNISDITRFCAKEYIVTKPKPELTTAQVLDFLRKSKAKPPEEINPN
jgi:hypothetical protein